jgi:hypothetical protein
MRRFRIKKNFDDPIYFGGDIHEIPFWSVVSGFNTIVMFERRIYL